ncbi:hypothetical protein BwSH20_05370 [Bradyrhizobium ottawaense]|nr:hypothetical protein SG09_29030 [Bradyrhizobium ottawaense]GMO19990.1 hypothetical protein BwSH14_13490 [Bradyrhizobium ottawaense]GMO31177.1 hypothetical protein BwSF12_29680 [Bradyrhizobium ottawaense]GMO35148.1 hypothetical protein BwSF21_41510 [Bradyrhizobium ottawaense]GMO70883.1 hypothetical protein BwSG10_28930 [Bradyrhizobium ottawaense]
MPAKPRARSFGLALVLVTSKPTPSLSKDLSEIGSKDIAKRVHAAPIRGSAGRLLLSKEYPMKTSNAAPSAFSLTRYAGNLRIARSSLIRSAHLLERIGLAAVGASCGLYVGAALLRQKGGLFESGWIVLLTVLYGALSYYVGIDLSRSIARRSISSTSEEYDGSEMVEIMSAAGTFGAAIAAALSVSILVLDQNLPNGLVAFVAGCWVVGSSLQVAAGAMARNCEVPDNKD